MIDTLIKNLDRKEKVTRDELQELAKLFSDTYNNVFFRFATGVSKSRCCLESTKHLKKVLLVVDKNMRKQNWVDEMNKWGYDTSIYEFTHYRSLSKYFDQKFDCIAFDESDCLSEQNVVDVKNIQCSKFIFMTADVTVEKEKLFKEICNYKTWKIKLDWAIDKGLLPEPKLNILQIDLRNVKGKFNYIKFGKVSMLSASEYLVELEKDMDYWKKETDSKGWGSKTNPTGAAFKVYSFGRERKQFFETIKLSVVKELYKQHESQRGIIFVGSIETANEFPNPIHSKKLSKQEFSNNDIIKQFNNFEINWLTCVDILVRGQNLKDCEIGIIGSFTGNPTKLLQSCGRLLRHENPIIYIPTIANTKDEANLNKFLKTYSKPINYINY